MGRMRSEMSKKNKYWIPSERYLELKHFCLQYPAWQKEYVALDCVDVTVYDRIVNHGYKRLHNPTLDRAMRMKELDDRCTLIYNCAKKADIDIYSWLMIGITRNLSYDKLKAHGIPCGKDYYYNAYHKFFFLLDKERK